MYRFSRTALFGFFALAAAYGQQRALGDFDIRDTPETQQAVTLRTRSLVERRRLAASAPGARAVLNRHGLPKLYRREGGALTGSSQRLPEEIAKDFLAANRSL